MEKAFKPAGLALLALAAAFCGALEGAEAQNLLWKQDFESRLPGELPEGWRLAWGTMPPCDLLATSDMERLDGKRSLLLDRSRMEEQPSQYGFSCLSPSLPPGPLVLTVCFQCQGAGSESSFAFEIRDSSSQKRYVVLGAGNGDVVARRGDFKKGANLGPMRAGQWQRVSVVFPESKESPLSVSLETLGADGSWRVESSGAQVSQTTPLAADRKLNVMLCSGIARGPFKLYVDSISAAPAK